MAAAQKGVLHHRLRSWYSFVNKVWVWCATWQSDYSICVMCERAFFLNSESAFLVQNCQQLRQQSAYSVTTAKLNRHEAATLTEMLNGENSNVSQACHTVMKN